MDATTKNKIGEFVCGADVAKYPVYRSSFYLTRFFQEIVICHNTILVERNILYSIILYLI